MAPAIAGFLARSIDGALPLNDPDAGSHEGTGRAEAALERRKPESSDWHRRPAPAIRGLTLVRGGQGQIENRTDAELTLHRQVTVHRARQIAADGERETSALVRRFER